jgi:type III secretion protein N (ATPase)
MTVTVNDPFARARAVLRTHELSDAHGFIQGALGLTLHARMPGARRGDWLRIQKRDGSTLDTEVISFDGEDVVLLPFGNTDGVGPGDPVKQVAGALFVRCSDALLGRVVDGLGRSLDGEFIEGQPWTITRAAPSALSRPRIARVLSTGVRAIDALCTLGEGQRIGLFAPAGVGKTTLLGQIAHGSEADVTVVALIGERGRELNDWLEDNLDLHTRARSVVVCATSDEPALVRMKSAYVATTIAEYFRAQGKRVLLLVDSLTRFVRAAREVGLAAGEPPLRRGFPPSAFSQLAPLIERTGRSSEGSITAIYSILVEGNDLDEPVSDEAKGLLDGHLVLSRELAQRGRFPALDVPRSLSRLMDGLVSSSHRQSARELRHLISHHEQKRELLELGAYVRGSDKVLERALQKEREIESILAQARDEYSSLEYTLEKLEALRLHGERGRT